MLDFGYYNMDCMEGMKQFPDKFFDLAIPDPQYGIREARNNNSSRSCLAISKNYDIREWDDKRPDFEYFKELLRISKNQIILGGNYFADLLPASSCWIVWDKDNGENDFADCELAWTSFDTAVRKFKWKWHGMLQQDMKHKEIRIHRNQKPVALYRWLLQNYAKPGIKLIDTHVGSASSLIAFEWEGFFDYVGFETDKDYYRDSKHRLET